MKSHISIALSALIVLANLLPAIHAFSHHDDTTAPDPLLKLEITEKTAHCALCDFHISNSTVPDLLDYKTTDAQKEIAYSISLTATVNLYPDPLFSLRAPPVG